VTYAAHYPVGYPALMSLGYLLFGSKPGAAMLINAVLGALSCVSVHALASRLTSRQGAMASGVAASLHVALVAYVPALMTEGATASLWVIGAHLAQKAKESRAGRRYAWLAAAGLTLGLSILVRPQSALLIPVFGWFAAHRSEGLRSRIWAAACVTAIAAAVCIPWVARNEVRMKHAAISFNGGWNLLIGTSQTAGGTWAPLEVPEACKLVFDEAEKDVCFGREARKIIRAAPLAWAKLIPQKLGVTFDYCGAAGWYLHTSNSSAFSYDWKIRLGVIETIFDRILLIGALVGIGKLQGRYRRSRLVVAGLGIVSLFVKSATWGYLSLATVLWLWRKEKKDTEVPLVVWAAASVISLTAATHAVFFGAGRYGMVVFPFVAAIFGAFLTRAGKKSDTASSEGDVPRCP
jgi:4-amino-4-deoxy-L-arabinose transferase-like glycosyltransferase